jgi:hypothetical protein
MEQCVVIRSCPLPQAGQWGLRVRLANAQEPVTALNQRGWDQHQCIDPSAMWEAVDALLARDRVL